MLWSEFQPLADSIAAQSQELAKEMGDGSDPGSPVTASDGAQANINRIVSFGVGKEDLIEALLKGFQSQFQKVTTSPNAYTFAKISSAALSREVGGINTFLTAESERVAPEFKTIVEMMLGEVLDPANTFSPVVDPMDQVSITGVDTANWVHQANIDVSKYFAANCEMIKTSAAGVADVITWTLACTQFDGTVVPQIVLNDASDAVSTLSPIGAPAPSVDKYIDIELTSMTCLITSIGETWDIRSILERVVAL